MSKPYRSAIACIVISVVLHTGLIAVSGGSGGLSREFRGYSTDLHVALVDAAQRAFASSSEGAPEKIEPVKFSPIPGYPKLLKFSPIDLPRARFDESEYRPLSELTRPPTAAEEITIEYPYDPYRLGLLVASLALFIDEDGSVAKVRAEDPKAPSNYERAAVEAFAKARFNPGMVGDRAVKSRLVIRVAFESGGPGPSTSTGIRVSRESSDANRLRHNSGTGR
jgi:TonB family protein